MNSNYTIATGESIESFVGRYSPDAIVGLNDGIFQRARFRQCTRRADYVRLTGSNTRKLAGWG
jgi:hypothetical protein